MSCRIHPSRPYIEFYGFRPCTSVRIQLKVSGDLIITSCRTTIRAFDGCPAFCWARRMGTLCFFLAGMSLMGGIAKPRPNSRALTENTPVLSFLDHGPAHDWS
jgi:hypothetical protein